MAVDLAIYRRAARLAGELGHHLFDTRYHAVALESDALLVDCGRAAGAGPLGYSAFLREDLTPYRYTLISLTHC